MLQNARISKKGYQRWNLVKGDNIKEKYLPLAQPATAEDQHSIRGGEKKTETLE